MCIIYPIGIPLAMYFLLWSRRRDIEKRTTRDGDESLASLSLLFGMYAKKRWWMAVADFFRRCVQWQRECRLNLRSTMLRRGCHACARNVLANKCS